MKANLIQIGGDHYKVRAIQPWDFYLTMNTELPLFFTSLRYFTRWKDKGGVADLEKVIHYIDKQLEASDLDFKLFGKKRFNPTRYISYRIKSIEEYCIINKVEYNLQKALESLYLFEFINPFHKEHLLEAKAYTQGLINAINEIKT